MLTSKTTPAADDLRIYAQRIISDSYPNRSRLESRSPAGRVSRTLEPQVQELLRQTFSEEAIVALDSLCCNAYWLAELVVPLCQNAAAGTVTPEMVRSQADALREMVAGSASYGALLRKVNSGMFGELTAEEKFKAKDYGLIVTDETWPFPDDQDRINSLFIL